MSLLETGRHTRHPSALLLGQVEAAELLSDVALFASATLRAVQGRTARASV